MKHDPRLTGKRRLLKKAGLFLVAATVLLFSACSQQPTPNQGLESQGLGTWSGFPNPAGNGGDGHMLSVTTDNNNYPIVAYKGWNFNLQIDYLEVKRWSGNSWQDIGASLTASGTEVDSAVLVKNGDAPLIAYSKSSLGNYTVHVRRWNGSGWLMYIGSPLNIDPAKSATQPTLVLDSSGQPIVAWTEKVPANSQVDYGRKVFVKRWNGAGWDLLGTAGIANASQPQLAMGENGQLFLAYLKCVAGRSACTNEDVYVARWQRDSTASAYIWKVIGQTLEVNAVSTVDKLQLAVHNNQPVVAWRDKSDYHIYMKRYLPCSTSGCTPVWSDLGKSDTTAWNPFTLAVNSAGEPIVAYLTGEGVGSRIFVSRVVSANNWSYVGDYLCFGINHSGGAALSVTGMNYTVACDQVGIEVVQYNTP